MKIFKFRRLLWRFSRFVSSYEDIKGSLLPMEVFQGSKVDMEAFSRFVGSYVRFQAS